jgi:hypothetical protein
VAYCCAEGKKAAPKRAALIGGRIVPALAFAAHSYPRPYLRILYSTTALPRWL